MEDLAIIGIGLHPFGRHEGKSGLDMAVDAIREALRDAGVEWKDIQCAFGGSKDSGYADSLVSKLGPTGIPFVNVFNGCATGGSVLINAITWIRSGLADIALVVGFDKHDRGMFVADPKEIGLKDWYADTGFMVTVQYFAMKTQRYMYDHGITTDCLVRVAMKNFYNGSLNSNAWRRTAFDYDTIANSRMLCDPLRQYMLCSPSEGAAAMVLCRASMARRFTNKPIFIKGFSLRTREFGSFEVFNTCKPLEETSTPVELAAKSSFEMAGIEPADIEIAQVQDSESGHEIMHMAETGLCAHGMQEQLIRDGVTRIDGRLPINTDGGLLANGEPIGASALRQVYEVCLQMRGDAGARQTAKAPKTGLCQVYGAPGVSSVLILQR